MNFLKDKRQASVIGVLSALLAATALMVGAGSAGAADAYCRTDGTTGDATINLPGVVFVQNDQENLGNPEAQGTWVCMIPPNQGAGVGMRNPNPSTAGAAFAASTCGDVTGGCYYIDTTGAEVEPTTTTNMPLGGAAGSGGSVGTGPGTCVYINGTPTCPLGAITIASVNINEGDLPQTTPGSTPVCVGVFVNGSCVGTMTTVPTVTVGGDTTNDTIEVDVAGTRQSVNVPRTCIGLVSC